MQSKFLSMSAILVLVFVLVSSIFSSSFAHSTVITTQRYVRTIPDLLRGTPDDSIKERLEDFSEVEISYIEFSAERETGRTSEYLIQLKRYGLAGFLLMWQFWLMVVVRATRAANNAPSISDRSMGIVSMIVAMTMVISGIGTAALLDPGHITVLLIVVGLTPVMSRVHSPIPSCPRGIPRVLGFRHSRQLFSSLVNACDYRTRN
jgi:hypothetical protein